jgi:hypothetical protein
MNKALFPHQRKSSFWKIIFYGFAGFILLLVFSSYFAPDMMVAITTQVWALCGWQ